MKFSIAELDTLWLALRAYRNKYEDNRAYSVDEAKRVDNLITRLLKQHDNT